MDERQQQIRERAGLEESRLNQDFIEFLQRYGTPLLLGVALIAVGYSLWNRYEKAEDTKVGAAFAALEAARKGENPSPDTLISVAEEHAGRGAVPLLARREAADIYLDCAIRGIKPGSTVNADGTLASEDDAVKTPEERDSLLSQAQTSYQWIVDKTQSDPDKAQHTMAGLYGLAAVAETRGDWDKAKSYYEQVVTLTKQKGYANQQSIAEARMKNLGDLAKIDPLPAKAQVPAPIPAPAPPAPPVSMTPTPAPSPAPAPAPATQPAPATPPTTPPATPAPGGG